MSPAVWIRERRDRPITDRERRGALAIVLVLLIGAAFLLALTRPVASRHVEVGGAPMVTHTEAPLGQASASRAPFDNASSLADSSSPSAVVNASRVFLAGYLAYLYGRAPARQIRDATPILIRSLQANPPRVSPAMREQVPRIIGLHSTPAPAGQFGVQAIVNDGGLVNYPIGLLLEDRSGRLLVIGLDGEG